MNWTVLLAAMCGYAVGNLPDGSTAWASVKVAFTIGLLVITVVLARRKAS